MDEVEVTVIGAGVVGLAIAAELSKDFESVVVLERHEKFGQETSSRNSEVIHAGIYYPEGSLKARLCVEGADLLYRYCEARAIPCKRIGKLIVAVDESEIPDIEELYENGIANGAKGIRIIDGSRDLRARTGGKRPTRHSLSPHRDHRLALAHVRALP